MKSRSLVGPVILIGLGVLFLINNLRPEVPMFRLLAEYWPFLLIVWGGLRLVEAGVAWAGRRPLPQGRLKGGEVALVIFICLIGSAMHSAHRRFPTFTFGPFSHRSVEIFGEPFDYPVSVQKPVTGIKRVVVENLRGNVRLAGTDSMEIRVTGRNTVRAFSRTEADQANAQSAVEVVLQGDQAVIRTNQERITDQRRVSSDLEINVPRGVSVEGRGRRGDFDILNIDGSVDINSGNAGVRLDKVGGDVRVDLRDSDIIRAVGVKGKVEVTGKGSDIELQNISGPVTVNGSYSGDLEFKNLAQLLHFQSRNTDLLVTRLPGQIRMDLGKLTATDVVGPMRLTTRTRDVAVEQFTQSLELALERGNIALRPRQAQLPRIEAKLASGDIELALPAASRFNLKAATERGEAENEFGPPLKLESRDHGATVSGVTGQGPELSLITRRGSLRVTKE